MRYEVKKRFVCWFEGDSDLTICPGRSQWKEKKGFAGREIKGLRARVWDRDE